MNASTPPICPKCHKPMRLALVKGMRDRKYQCLDCEGEDPLRSRDISKLLEHLRPPKSPPEMSRYFFHVVGGDREYRDDNGLRFDSSQDAAAHAAKIAAELAQDGDQYRGFAVAVTDEDDRELQRVFVKLTDASEDTASWPDL